MKQIGLVLFVSLFFSVLKFYINSSLLIFGALSVQDLWFYFKVCVLLSVYVVISVFICSASVFPLPPVLSPSALSHPHTCTLSHLAHLFLLTPSVRTVSLPASIPQCSIVHFTVPCLVLLVPSCALWGLSLSFCKLVTMSLFWFCFDKIKLVTKAPRVYLNSSCLVYVFLALACTTFG